MISPYLQDAKMGDFYQNKPSLNINSAVNFVLTRPVSIQRHPGANIEREVMFPDASFYQEEIEYSIMRLQADTIVVRIGQNLWPDDQFDRNYLEAKKQGMRVGGYWFYDDRVSPREQAELFVSLCAGKTFELEIFIDWEVSYGGEFKGLKNVVAMMELIDMAIEMGVFRAKGTGIYTGYYFFRGNSNPIANASQYAYLKNKPLWLAWYTDNPAIVLIPAPWTELTLWQFGTPAVNWGQKTKEIDMNWFSGTRQEFEIRYGESGEPPMADYIELKSNIAGQYRSIRRPTAYPQVPHIAGASFGRLESGQTIQLPVADAPYTYAGNIRYETSGVVYEAYAGDKWWKVSVNGEVGWIAEIHKGVRYLEVKVVQDPTPPSTSHVVEVFIDGVLEFRKELP